MSNENTRRVTVERRRCARFRVRAPANFEWPVSDQLRAGDGLTRDISTSGVFVESPSQPPVGARIQLSIFLPGMQDLARGVCLSGEGFVVRAEREGHASGFAAAVLFHPEPEESLLTTKNGGAERPVN